MTSRTVEELGRRSGCDGWTYYLWAISLTLGTVVFVYLTLRRSLALLIDPVMALSLFVCLMSLIMFWRDRPRKRKLREYIRLNLD